MSKTLLITPPFLQPNTPYPATAYLAGYLRDKGLDVVQYDLSIKLLSRVFSADFLARIFDNYTLLEQMEDGSIERTYSLRRSYITTIDCVMRFLQGNDPTLATRICNPGFLPQSTRFDSLEDMDLLFGELGQHDCAKHLATLYLQDISDFIRATVSEHFEVVRYGESLSISTPNFSILADYLSLPLNLIELEMLSLLDAKLREIKPDYVGFTIPFPGNLLAALRCGEHIKNNHPKMVTMAGGGYPSTELRSMSDTGIFDYFDYVILDSEEWLEKIIRGEITTPKKLLQIDSSKECQSASCKKISHLELGCPDYSGLPHRDYFSLLEMTNPMHRLWSDGRWNKMTLAHGCYWAKCGFCDTTLDYIGRYDAGASATILVEWMIRITDETGSRNFHFTDEAAPPKLLKELSLEILRRGEVFSWWTNVRFESAFTGDLCNLMATAGCIAVSGGLEVANDRLLEVINKGVSIESATITLRNMFYSGIMTHTYLMYGLPTQTLQESVDSLEVVRQMFLAELIDSAFWHRYAMTIHSPMGQEPEKYGMRLRTTHLNSFANNEIRYVEDRGYNINLVGEALNEALYNYMHGGGLERGVHRWFQGKIPQTTIEDTLIVDHLIKPDSCRIYNPGARLVWVGAALPFRVDEGVVVNAASEQKLIRLTEEDGRFMEEITEICADLSRTTKFERVGEIYAKYSDKPFSEFYHSKKWDELRKYGLLQI